MLGMLPSGIYIPLLHTSNRSRFCVTAPPRPGVPHAKKRRATEVRYSQLKPACIYQSGHDLGRCNFAARHCVTCSATFIERLIGHIETENVNGEATNNPEHDSLRRATSCRLYLLRILPTSESTSVRAAAENKQLRHDREWLQHLRKYPKENDDGETVAEPANVLVQSNRITRANHADCLPAPLSRQRKRQ